MRGAATPQVRRRLLVATVLAALIASSIGTAGSSVADAPSGSAPKWRLWAVEVTRTAPSLAPKAMIRLRLSGVNALVVDARRVGAQRVAAVRRAAARHDFTLVAPTPAGTKTASAAESSCAATTGPRAACAFAADSLASAARLASGLTTDLVVTVRVTHPSQLRKLPAASRAGRILVIVPLARGRLSDWRNALTGVAARSDVDVAVVPGAGANERLLAYLDLLRAQLERPDQIAPSAPRRVEVAASTTASASLRWQPSRDNRRVAGYVVARPGARNAAVSAPSFTLGGLACGTAYSVQVAAVDASGNRSRSTATTVATATCPTGSDEEGGGSGGGGGGSGGGGGAADTVPPTIPLGFARTGSTTTTISVSWTASTDAVGVVGYRFFVGGILVGTTPNRSYVASGLTCGSTYQLGVEAYDAAGNNSARSTLSAATNACPGGGSDTTAPTTPSGLSRTAATATSLTVAWTASTDAVGVDGYGLYRNGTRIAGSTGTSYTFTGLACGTSYTLGVDAYDAAGNRSSVTSLAATTSACPPSVPTGLARTGSTATSISLSWNASSGDVAGYSVYRGTTLVLSTASRTATVTGLACGTTYSLSVDAYNTGATVRSAQATINAATSACAPTDTTPPTVPASLTASGQTTSSVSLSWPAATDDVGVTGYGLYSDNVLTGSATGTSGTISGLACGTSYTLAVDAVDAAGNRSARRSISASTAACPPPPPPPGGLTPPARATTVLNAPAGTTVRNDTYYLEPLGNLDYPDNLQRVTVVGAKNMPDYVRNWKDVWVEGKPNAYMNAGPDVDADLMQIKRYPATAQLPEDLTFRYFRMHDLTRTGNFHTDGLQLMAGRRIRFLDGVAERVNTQPFFVRDSGAAAGGGPIEDITFERITVTGSTDAFYAFRIAGDDEAASGGNVPTRVRVIDSAGDMGVSIDAAAAARGSVVINYRRI